tara:strand:+ start:898 stop:1155 length:258 start_codon:yes stop_codon:yes gene_type:complete
MKKVESTVKEKLNEEQIETLRKFDSDLKKFDSEIAYLEVMKFNSLNFRHNVQVNFETFKKELFKEFGENKVIDLSTGLVTSGDLD